MEKWVGAIIAVVFIVILGLIVYKIFGDNLIPFISDRVKDGVDELMYKMQDPDITLAGIKNLIA